MKKIFCVFLTTVVACVSSLFLAVSPAASTSGTVKISGPSKISTLSSSDWTVQVKPARVAPVVIYLDGKKVLSGKSDKKGQYGITWNPNVVGTFELVAAVSKSAGYSATKSAVFKITVLKRKMTVETDDNGWPEQVYWNDEVSVTAKVTPNIGKYNKGLKVQLEYKSANTGKWIVEDTASTDSHGQVDLTFDTNSELSGGRGDTCDQDHLDLYDGATYTYQLRVLGTKLTKEASSESYELSFYCSDGTDGGSNGSSSITVDANSTDIDLAMDSLEIAVYVDTESTDYTVTEQYCDAEVDDCSDESNWYFSSSQSYGYNESNSFLFTPDYSPGTYDFRYVLETYDTEEEVTSNSVEVLIYDSSW